MNLLRSQEPPAGARLIFTKTLKGSSPEFEAVSVDPGGKGTYDSHKLGDEPSPRPLQLSGATTAQMFSLTASLNYFRSLELESRHKVANMGLKTFTYEDGSASNRVQFNYTENHLAQQLTEMFEKIANVEEQIDRLEWDMKYDPLSLSQVLRGIEIGMEEHEYVEPDLMVPTLEKISANSHFLHLAQTRAQEIMQRIQENK